MSPTTVVDHPPTRLRALRHTAVNPVRNLIARVAQQARSDAVLAERARLAGELHDTLLQSFTGVTLRLQTLRRRMLTAPCDAERELGHILQMADIALREARSVVWDMRVPQVDTSDVAAALEEDAEEAVASHRIAGGAPVGLAVTITGERRRLLPSVEAAVRRIAREAVANALRHSGAKQICVSIAFDRQYLRVAVCDDGVGFDVARLDPRAGRGHWGLVGIGERARAVRGSLDITSAPRRGTSIVVRVPSE